jgi:hypothetical protein
VFDVSVSAAVPALLVGAGAIFENIKRKREIVALRSSLNQALELLEIEKSRVDNIREWISRGAPVSEKI